MRIHALLVCVLLLAAGGPASTASAEHHEEASNTKFGLTEAERREVFRELAQVETRAEQEAARRFAADPESPDKVRLAERLAEEYRADLAERRGIDTKALTEIGAEGYLEKWPILLAPAKPPGVATEPPPQSR